MDKSTQDVNARASLELQLSSQAWVDAWFYTPLVMGVN